MSNDRKKDKSKLSRRQFLGQASCAAVGTTALYSTVLNMGMMNALASTTPGNYRALVCIFMSGGIDSYNVLVPRGAAEHAEYAAIRRDLALPIDQLLELNPATPQGRDLGLHPAMLDMQTLFDGGDAALVANVGTLVEPTTMEQFRSRSVRLPLGLFSHSDQQMHWQTSVPDSRTSIGWGGRMADLLQSLNSNQNISMNISLSGTNVFQSGQNTALYTIDQNGSRGLRDYNGTSQEALVMTDAVDGLLGLNYQHLFETTFARRMRGAIDADVDFRAALAAIAPLQTQFSDTRLSRQMEMIARTIAARDQLGLCRQTFFVQTGGWDHHDEVLNNQANMLPVINNAIAEFQAAMVELGVQDDVTTFTSSDFARTLTSNGRGSDHAWGGNHLVVGGAVNGGDIYGQYPDLFQGNSLDTGRGRLIPTTSVDQYFAELALWFGVPRTDLELVFPNIARFYDPLSAAGPLGLMGAGGAPAPPSPNVGEIVDERGTRAGAGDNTRRKRVRAGAR